MLMESGNVMLHNKLTKIETPYSYHDLSAHAGMSELDEYVRLSDPSVVVCVHGDADNATALAKRLAEKGYETYAPKIGETLKLEQH